MPPCKECRHAGEDHYWRLQRLRGYCQLKDCDCTMYILDTPLPKPVSKVIGRILYNRESRPLARGRSRDV
jgi:hypothetical protein